MKLTRLKITQIVKNSKPTTKFNSKETKAFKKLKSNNFYKGKQINNSKVIVDSM